ncbi:MAG: CoA-binding protein [Candidatus Gracilibacteria bacterium]|jgi:predicted CoA-binding protein|nr:CoA-binding protein [Candidatus Gracilibacteria bacterium]
MIQRDPAKFINKDFTYAVVGASNDSSEFGFHVFGDLLKKGYKALAINTSEMPDTEIQKKPCYPNLTSARPFPDAVVIVDISPFMTLEMVKQMRDGGFYRLWLEEDTYDNEVLNFCDQNNIDYFVEMEIRKFL